MTEKIRQKSAERMMMVKQPILSVTMSDAWKCHRITEYGAMVHPRIISVSSSTDPYQ